MIGQHIVWFLLTMVCVAWYSTITIYVAIKGATDIKQMLKRLSDSNDASPASAIDPPKLH
jgi:hypothetical protein